MTARERHRIDALLRDVGPTPLDSCVSVVGLALALAVVLVVVAVAMAVGGAP